MIKIIFGIVITIIILMFFGGLSSCMIGYMTLYLDNLIQTIRIILPYSYGAVLLSAGFALIRLVYNRINMKYGE